MDAAREESIDALIDAFEAECRSGRRPDVATTLQCVAEEDRASLLHELVRLDLEYRLRAGESARVNDYLAPFPSLSEEVTEFVGLIVLEYRVRQDCGELVLIEEYVERFPHLQVTLPLSLEPYQRSPSQVPGYEILEELGRGGMGVVYKARHLRLNRLVALKMILAGGHAGQAARERLHMEAEAVARLNHPCVVQIFEAGEHGGLPFVTLELCPGGSLDRLLVEGPLHPQGAARLVMQVASGVHAAHEANVVHRDLKPANILLLADGTPKVTDFGLAKCLDGSFRTGSGTVLGTPGYMAPEQAEGQERKVGPLVDLHALGAILYECLTGRPPFVASTAMETLRKVINEVPIPPRNLNPAVPSDLETICLKCLEKTPARRYASAALLAEDLQRFLAGEPILARPASRWRSTWLSTGRLGSWLLYWVITVGLIVALVLWKQPTEPTRSADTRAALVMHEWTGEAGREMCPTFSPDGTQLAYVWAGNEPTEQNADIYVRSVKGTDLRRLTTNSQPDWSPTWSPDSRWIAFVRWRGKVSEVLTVPIQGGEETLATQVPGQVQVLQWSPVETDTLAYVVPATQNQPARIQTWSRRHKRARDVLVADSLAVSFHSLRFSPDGSQLAFVKRPARFASEHVLSVTSLAGEQRVIHSARGVNGGLTWTADGDYLLFAFARGSRTTLWQIPASGGVPRPVLEGAERLMQPDVSRQGQRLAFVKYLDDWDINRIDLGSEPGEKIPTAFLRSSGSQDSPAFSQDGKRVAFTSDRSGILAVYVANVDRPGAAQRVADEEGADLGSPRWSPDGKWLAYDTTQSGRVSIRLVDSTGQGKPTPLRIDNLDLAYLPDWATDGKSLFVTTTRHGKEQIWRVPTTGGQADCVTPEGGAMPRATSDGQWLYYHRGPSTTSKLPEIRRIHLTSGTDERVRELPGPAVGHGWNAWAIAGDAVYYLDLQRNPFCQLLRLPFSQDTVERLGTFRQREYPHLLLGTYPGPRIAVDPLGRNILFVEFRHSGSTIHLVDNFR
ncbi:MAG: LpqB family beta-propeller domain-containing protein [Gemmataceae bacterium]